MERDLKRFVFLPLTFRLVAAWCVRTPNGMTEPVSGL
jgi:hypothetical protein